jgi:pentatricopeptide repeat domain-containing protein 1
MHACPSCAGAQWEKAAEVFAKMQRQGCRPDVVTYTALIQAYERGGQWRRALAAFDEMVTRPCTPDSIVYNAIIDVLWETGVAWAQRKAAALFRRASAEGLIRRHSHLSADSAELNLHSTTAGVALLSLHCWLQDLQ